MSGGRGEWGQRSPSYSAVVGQSDRLVVFVGCLRHDAVQTVEVPDFDVDVGCVLGGRVVGVSLQGLVVAREASPILVEPHRRWLVGPTRVLVFSHFSAEERGLEGVGVEVASCREAARGCRGVPPLGGWQVMGGARGSPSVWDGKSGIFPMR